MKLVSNSNCPMWTNHAGSMLKLNSCRPMITWNIFTPEWIALQNGEDKPCCSTKWASVEQPEGKDLVEQRVSSSSRSITFLLSLSPTNESNTNVLDPSVGEGNVNSLLEHKRQPRHTPRYRYLSVCIYSVFRWATRSLASIYPNPRRFVPRMTRRALWSRSCMSCGGSCAMRLIDIFITNRCSFGDIRNGYVIRITAI